MNETRGIKDKPALNKLYDQNPIQFTISGYSVVLNILNWFYSNGCNSLQTILSNKT